MVYAEAARKTGAYMLLAGVLSLSIVTFLSGDLEATGNVVAESTSSGVSSSGWAIFAIGLFTGALMVGTYVYVAHLEAKRDE